MHVPHLRVHPMHSRPLQRAVHHRAKAPTGPGAGGWALPVSHAGACMRATTLPVTTNVRSRPNALAHARMHAVAAAYLFPASRYVADMGLLLASHRSSTGPQRCSKATTRTRRMCRR